MQTVRIPNISTAQALQDDLNIHFRNLLTRAAQTELVQSSPKKTLNLFNGKDGLPRSPCTMATTPGSLLGAMTFLFSTRAIYQMIADDRMKDPNADFIWSSRVPDKSKFFAWLFCNDGLNTRRNLFRKTLVDRLHWPSSEEDRQNLFFICTRARGCLDSSAHQLCRTRHRTSGNHYSPQTSKKREHMWDILWTLAQKINLLNTKIFMHRFTMMIPMYISICMCSSKTISYEKNTLHICSRLSLSMHWPNPYCPIYLLQFITSCEVFFHVLCQDGMVLLLFKVKYLRIMLFFL